MSRPRPGEVWRLVGMNGAGLRDASYFLVVRFATGEITLFSLTTGVTWRSSMKDTFGASWERFTW